MNDSIMVQVTMYYKGKHSALEIDLSEYKNADHYLEIIKCHLNIAKQIIDRQTAQADQ